MTDHSDIDKVTGTATTGHEWDGIKELNTPLPPGGLLPSTPLHRFGRLGTGSSIRPGRLFRGTQPACCIIRRARMSPSSWRISKRYAAIRW